MLRALGVLCSVPYSLPLFTNLIDTYVALPIYVHITLLICLSSSSFCISICVIHAYVYFNLYTHFPPLSYSHTIIAIFI